MKYLLIGAMWLVTFWFHVWLAAFVLPLTSLFSGKWWAFPMMLTHICGFVGYSGYFLYWAYTESERGKNER